MKDCSRRRPGVQGHLTIMLTMCLLLPVCSARATGQQYDREITLPSVVDSEIVEIPPGMSSLPDSGFWFLSTEPCPQSFDRSCPQFCPAVSRYDECVGFRSSDLPELIAGLEPGLPVCIMIHGSFVENSTACRESACVWRWLLSAGRGDRMQMIYFRWPSFRPITPLITIDVNALGRRASRNGYYLAELIHQIPVDCPVCLIGHSHGSRVAAGGLHLLAGGSVQGVCHPFARTNGRRIRTVFSAAGMDHDWMNPGKRYDRALCSTECILNLYNRIDPVLALYPLRLPVISSQPLGLIGLTESDRRKMNGQANRIVNCDVTRRIGLQHLFPSYFSDPDLAMMMRNYVYFPERNSAAMIVGDTEKVDVR